MWLTIDADLPTEGLLSFADYFFDGLAVDWMVQSRIENTRSRVYDCRRQVDGLLMRLRERSAALEGRQAELRGELERLVAEG